MKKIAGVIFALILIAGAAAWWFIFRTPGLASPAAYLPSDTLLYVEVPDGVQSFTRYQNSSIKKVYESDEVKVLFGAFLASLEKSAKESKEDGAEEAFKKMGERWDSFGKVLAEQMNGTSFAAVLPVEGEKSLNMVMGFRPKAALGNPESMVQWIDKVMEEEVAKDGGETVKVEDRDHAGIGYRVIMVSAKQGEEVSFEIAYGAHDGWMLLGGGTKGFCQFLDSLQGNVPASPLEQEARFQEFSQRHQGAKDMVMYMQVLPFLEQLFTQSMRVSAMAEELTDGNEDAKEAVKEVEEQMKMQRSYLVSMYEGMGATYGVIWFEGDQLKSSSWTEWAEGLARDFSLGVSQPLAFDTYPLTSSDTIIYSSKSYELEKTIQGIEKMLEQVAGDLPADQQMAVGMASQWRTMAGGALTQIGLDLDKNLINPMGSEGAYVIDWKKGERYPALTAVTTIDQAEDFMKTFSVVNGYAPMLGATGMGEVNSGEEEGVQFIEVKVKDVEQVAPTIFFGNNLFGLSTSQSAILGQVKSGKANVMNVPENYQKESFYFTSMKLKEMVELGYPSVRDWLRENLEEIHELNESFANLKEGDIPERLSFTDALGDAVMRYQAEGDVVVAQSEMKGEPIMPLLVCVGGIVAQVVEDTGGDMGKLFQSEKKTQPGVAPEDVEEFAEPTPDGTDGVAEASSEAVEAADAVVVENEILSETEGTSVAEGVEEKSQGETGDVSPEGAEIETEAVTAP